MSTVTINQTHIADLLSDLLGRGVEATPADTVEPHHATFRGMVTNEDKLVAVIASDLSFAHRAGAALAMIPATTVEEKGDNVDPDLVAFYLEVANVMGRLVDEATPMRVRIDPNMEHSIEAMESIVAQGSVVSASEATIDGYGTGAIGVWYWDS